MTLALSAGHGTAAVPAGGKSDGTKWGSRGGNIPVRGTYGRAMWANSSRGRRVLILVLVREAQGRGPVSGFLHLDGLSDVGSLNGYGAGKLAGSRAAAVHIGEGVQASVMAASLLLCLSNNSIGGRVASTARMSIGVVEKQLVTQR